MHCAGTFKGVEFGDGDSTLDPSVVRALPKGSCVLSIMRHGTSFWANTGRIDVALANGGEPKSYFIKAVSGCVGRYMAKGEFESLTAMHGITPDFVPKPIAWGSYDERPDTHFLLCEFRDMVVSDCPKAMPDPDKLAACLSELHQSESPDGKFGFEITTYSGNLPQYTGWEDSWETFFAKSLRQALDFEVERKGCDDELDTLAETIFAKVIPRLLRPLETDGRSIKPSLVHGDLWYANAGTDTETGQCLVFDPCCFYAHNEYEFGQWRPVCNRFDDKYLDAYYRRPAVKKSEPVEDFEGRLDLYRLRFDTHVSALFVDDMKLRIQVINDMQSLVDRYG